MIPSVISKLIILLFGTLYPAYASYKAVKTKNVKEYVKWMMYWIVFALFTSAETFTDIFLSFWFPFYYELKIILVVYLLSPATNGSSILYRKFVHPMLSKKEQEIDQCISKAMEQGYHTMLDLGSRSLAYTTSIIMETAIRSGGGLVNHIRKSYSLDDMNTHEARNRRITDGRDEPDEVEERPLMRHRVRNSPGRMSSGSQADLYYSDIDGPMGADRPRPVRSSGDFSSGYCSPDPMYRKYSRDPLVRTASMGPTTRARTRVASEDESGCSTTEPEESQYESDEGFPMRFPPLHPSLAQFVKPEYRYLFASLTQQQADALVNSASCVEAKPVAPPSTLLRSIITEKKDAGTKSVKHKKRQAPVPPEKGEEDYRTPEESPVPARKLIVPDLAEDGETTEEEPGRDKMEEKPADGKKEEKPAEEKPTEDKIEEKTKDNKEEKEERDDKKKVVKAGKESQITKMLHLSKIHIPFWNQKSGKHSPVQETSGGLPRNNSHTSLASQDSYISLKGEETVEESSKSEPERQMSVREMSQSPSSKRRSLAAE